MNIRVSLRGMRHPWMIAVMCVCAMVSIGAQAEPSAQGSAAFRAFLDDEFDAWIRMVPESGAPIGRDLDPSAWSDRSLEADQARLLWRRGSVERMRARFDRDDLDAIGQAAWDVWLMELEMAEERAKFPLHPYLLGGIFGAHTWNPRSLMLYQRVESVDDMMAYAQRIGSLSRAFRQSLERVKAAAGRGIRMPASEYQKAIQSCRALISGRPFDGSGKDSPLWADTERRLKLLEENGVDAESIAEAREAVRTSLTGAFGPAYSEFAAWLEDDQQHARTGHAGVSLHPDGAAWYAAAIFLNTSLRLSAEEIHQTGLNEVARIRAEMEAAKQKEGFKGSLKAAFDHLRTDPQFFLPNTDAGRQQYLERAEAFLTGVNKRVSGYFGLLPRARLEVRRVEAFREEPGGAANYSPASMDGSTPGIYYVHLIDMNAQPLWQIEEMAYHEGIPGHHLQVSIARELEEVPRVLSSARQSSFSEGWGLYAEGLAREMDFYTEPWSDFGRLTSEQWRAVRLVVDTGLHVKGWSEQQAIDYFLDNTPMAEAAVRFEVQRYLADPGQALAYKIGQLTISRLRDEARSALGDRFDYRAFHDVVLGAGSVPLPMLESRVRAWIESAGV